MPLHKDLTGANLHEPKGVAAASSNSAYFADGSGSGSWRKISADDLGSSIEANTIYMGTVLADVSTASFVLVPVPENMTLISALMVLGDSITDSDAEVSFTRNDSSSMGPSVTIEYSGSDEGTSFPFTSTTNSLVSSGGYVKVATDGASTGSVPLFITLKFKRTL